MIEDYQIVWCNMICITEKGEEVRAKNFYFSCETFSPNLDWSIGYDANIIRKFGLKNQNLTIKSIEILDTCGYRIKTKEFTIVKQIADEKRNIITGAYE